MEKVRSIEQLQQLSAEIRSLRLGYITNFFLDPVKHGLWIEKGDCHFERVGHTVFIVKLSSSFWNVFYCSTSIVDLGGDLSAFLGVHTATTMMFDIVGRDVQCQPVVELFRAKGCHEATSLVRMTRLTTPMEYVADDTVRRGEDADIPEISRLLHSFFDDQTEQIPYDEELLEYARQGHVLVCEENGKAAGFLVYELNATTLYLRYWFTHPDFRDHKVGSRLLRRFFEEGKDTKRQLFWVIRSNENAIKRYRHYGFVEENMYDFVMKYSKQETITTMKEQIIKILTELRPEFDFSQEGVNFIEEGMLDSFDMVSLIDSIETEMGVAISGADVLPENFCDVEAICKTIEKNRK